MNEPVDEENVEEVKDSSMKSNNSGEAPPISKIRKKDSTTVPLNISKEELKESTQNIDEKENKNEELGVIPEEPSEVGTIVSQIGKGHRGISQKFSGKGTLGENTEMKDLMHSLNKLSISENDIKEVSEEFSRASDSNEFQPQNVSGSSLSRYNKHLKKSKDGKEAQNRGLRWEIDDSGIQSISNITNYINPEENRANEGMIQSALINGSQNISSNKNSKLDVEAAKTLNKQQSRIINISEYYSDTSKAEPECKSPF